MDVPPIDCIQQALRRLGHVLVGLSRCIGRRLPTDWNVGEKVLNPRRYSPQLILGP